MQYVLYTSKIGIALTLIRTIRTKWCVYAYVGVCVCVVIASFSRVGINQGKHELFLVPVHTWEFRSCELGSVVSLRVSPLILTPGLNLVLLTFVRDSTPPPESSQNGIGESRVNQVMH